MSILLQSGQRIIQPVIMSLMGYVVAAVIGRGIGIVLQTVEFDLLPVDELALVFTIGFGFVGGILTLILELN